LSIAPGRSRRPCLAIGLAFLCAILLASCGQASGPSYAVGGQAIAGPVCPVERIPPDPACAPRPVVGAVLVITAGDGREVARATTDADGRWTMTLAAGEYTLTPQAVSGLLGIAPPVPFTVSTTGSSVSLDVAYDTGIR
jgi:carboxypeptidase family protein